MGIEGGPTQPPSLFVADVCVIRFLWNKTALCVYLQGKPEAQFIFSIQVFTWTFWNFLIFYLLSNVVHHLPLSLHVPLDI